jgi:Zn-dependent protease with chaperone function
VATLLAAVWLPGAAAAQTGAAPAPMGPPEEARAPIPPGVPTTAENVHLPTEGEVKLGRESAVLAEKQYKVVTSGPYHERLQRVAKEVVEAMQRPDMAAEYRKVYHLPKSSDRSRRVPFEYSFKVADTTKEINAFSLAGGPIYVTKGLMDYATTDHELAAVLAHECAHVAYHHVAQLVQKEKKLNSKQMWGLLATIIAGAAGGGAAVATAGNILLGSQLVSIATMTGYGRELEHEADRVGVQALRDTSYNPVGMMTFMEKLARDDRRRGNPDYGIYQSHPYSNERVAAIRKQLLALGYRVDPGTQRQVSGRFRTEVVPVKMGGKQSAEIRLNGKLVLNVVAPEDYITPEERARQIASRMSELFAENLTFNDVRKSPEQSAVLLKGIPVIRIYPEDALAAGGAEAALDRAYREILRALIVEQLDKTS